MNQPKKYEFNFLEKHWKKQIEFFNLEDINESTKLILMPPPNITGSLHLGHCLNLVIQDFITRYLTISGQDVIWISGFDHAGIATQSKIESLNIQIESEKQEFALKKWYPEKKEKFISQWKNLGFLLNYNQNNFTLNEFSKNKVSEYFSLLQKANLIYQKEKMINWDSVLMTAISDIEVEYVESVSTLFHIAYRIDGKNDYLIVCTTRPETIFADVAVFFNEEDQRYINFSGKELINPLNGNKIPIMSTNKVKKDFGSGLLKCTPLHDFADYELAIKYNLPLVSCYDEKNIFNSLAGKWKGRKVRESKFEIIDFLRDNGFILKEEEYKTNLPISQRSGAIIEPLLSLQWFLDIPSMIKEIEKDNKNFLSDVKISPLIYYDNLVSWKDIAHEWCISRQLWWGHKIPNSNSVLDTWFSSSLWPLIINSKYSRFKPIDYLVTGSDLIFFWVFRMIVFSYYFTKKSPFETIFIHGLIRDKSGRKMSKSLGNGLTPEDITTKYGSDSLRLFILGNNKMGSDIVFDNEKVKSYYFFLQKLWSIFNFIIFKIDNHKSLGFIKFEELKKIILIDENEFNKNLNIWIINELVNLEKIYTNNSKNLKTKVIIEELLTFVKEKISNFHINFSRRNFSDSCFYTSLYVLQRIIIIFNPIIPFFSNYVYDVINKGIVIDLNISTNKSNYLEQKEEFKSLFTLLTLIRKNIFSYFSSIKKNPKCVDFYLKLETKELEKEIINEFLIRVKEIDGLNIILSDLSVPNFGIIDLFPFGFLKFKKIEFSNQEIKDLLIFYDFEINRAQKILNNPSFLKKSPSKIVNIEREKLAKFKFQKKKVLEDLNNMENSKC